MNRAPLSLLHEVYSLAVTKNGTTSRYYMRYSLAMTKNGTTKSIVSSPTAT